MSHTHTARQISQHAAALGLAAAVTLGLLGSMGALAQGRHADSSAACAVALASAQATAQPAIVQRVVIVGHRSALSAGAQAQQEAAPSGMTATATATEATNEAATEAAAAGTTATASATASRRAGRS